jgi:hypothetical protein
MTKEFIHIIEDVKNREIGIEVAKNLILFDISIKPNLIKPAQEEIVDILESLQCMLLEVNVVDNLIKEVIRKYEGLY